MCPQYQFKKEPQHTDLSKLGLFMCERMTECVCRSAFASLGNHMQVQGVGACTFSPTVHAYPPSVWESGAYLLWLTLTSYKRKKKCTQFLYILPIRASVHPFFLFISAQNSALQRADLFNHLLIDCSFASCFLTHVGLCCQFISWFLCLSLILGVCSASNHQEMVESRDQALSYQPEDMKQDNVVIITTGTVFWVLSVSQGLW